MKKIKYKVYNIIEGTDNNLTSQIFNISIITLILINVIIVILGTFTLPKTIVKISTIIEIVSVTIFTFEYFCRVWIADLVNKKHAKFARIRYVFSFMALIDLLSILPFYIPFFIPLDLRVLRMLRVIRIFRIFKMNRYSNSLNLIAKVFIKQKSQLLSSTFVVSLLMIISSILMYNFENPAQPEVFKNAFSGLWWSIATLTTVGYGDIYPITVAGKILSSIIAMLGIGLVAVPTGIISAGFIEEINHHNSKEDKSFCPFCGKKI